MMPALRRLPTSSALELPEQRHAILCAPFAARSRSLASKSSTFHANASRTSSPRHVFAKCESHTRVKSE